MAFKVNVNDSIEFDLTLDDALKLDVTHISDSEYHILHNNKSFKAEITDSNFNQRTYKIKVNNNLYKINIYNQLDILIKEMGFSFATVKQINAIKAPMPGLILDIHVALGQKVKENEALLILEAMKMENIITSPRDGIIKSIQATKGNAVDKGALLLEFE